MLQVEWEHITLHSGDYPKLVERYNLDSNNIMVGALDTETTGLHIIHDKPFLIQFGWVTNDLKGVTFAVDLEEDYDHAIKCLVQFEAVAHSFQYMLGHNVKFDLHMLHNINHPYEGDNISDTMCWIRLGMPALPERKGGTPLALKQFASQYLTRNASKMEKELKEERTKIASEYNTKLKRYLGWTKGKIDEFFNDKIHDADDLPEDKRIQYYKWLDSLPDWLRSNVRGAVSSDDIPYNKLNRENTIYYAHLDIVWTIEVYLRMKEVVSNHGNLPAMNLENKLILPLVDVERVGMTIDRDYLESCKKTMKEYILVRREDLNRIAGERLKCSQSLRIKQLCKERFNRDVESTSAEEIDLLLEDMKANYPDDPIIEFLETIQELRTLEKWYSTYLIRFLKNTSLSNVLYTSMNQAGTVSGRFTSDLQQFPKKGIIGSNGVELFNPRKMATVPKEFSNMVFIDESGLELRTQAAYTVVVSGGDLHMCRAYCPFKCHKEDGTPYELGTKFEGKWYRDEDNEEWKPTDLHSATTLNCFDNISEEDENFHDLRYVGKRVNFASQYGGGISVFRRMFPKYSEEQIQKIAGAYGKTFPDVKKYQQWVIEEARANAYVENLFGVRYWGADGHHLINMLVQGSGAYFMKLKLIEQWQFLKDNNCKSKLFLQIHDETDYYIAPGEEWIVWELRKIQEKWEGNPIPMVADVEATKTTWYEKQEFKTEEEYLNWSKELQN